jgi:hypothetical protein
MKRTLRIASVLSALTLATACYHAEINTATPAGAQTIDIPWAHSFLWGLVPPAVVDSAAQCPSGVAQVITEHSFVNGLAAAVTFGIYTPMHINVTCAGGQGALDVPMVRTLAEAEAMLEAGETFLLPVRTLALE